MNFQVSTKKTFSDLGRGRLPEFICVGAQRCGTTTLWEKLNQHESLFLPKNKEIHFFDNREGHWDLGLDWYQNHFENAPKDAVCGEATPSYLYVPEACDRIHKVVPDVRILIILRNPVDRAWSQYWYNVRHGREPLNFKKAITEESNRLQMTSETLSRIRTAYIDRGRYINQILRYEKTFSREQMHVIFLSDLLEKPQEVMQGVWRHIGVDNPSFLLTNCNQRRNRGVYPRSRFLGNFLNSAWEWSNAQDSKFRFSISRIASVLRRCNLAEGTPKMQLAMRQCLEEIYQPYDAELSQWLGRPVPWVYGSNT